MPVGKQAKILTPQQLELVLSYSWSRSQWSSRQRNRVIILLSHKAGLRAREIAACRWPMVLDPEGRVSEALRLENTATKGGAGGRVIPLHRDLKDALEDLLKEEKCYGTPFDPERHIIRSARGRKMAAHSIVNFFDRLYRETRLEGCSSHSGRRTFITRLGKNIYRAGGTIHDVSALAGHKDIRTTQLYLQQDTDAQKKLIALID